MLHCTLYFISMKTVYIIRYDVGRKQSLGNVLIRNEYGNFVYARHLLELGWRNNQRNISCIPAGHYDLRLENSPKFKQKLWEAKGVPNRSECKFHVANFSSQINGCFAPGMTKFDLNRDGEKDMVNSREAFEEFMDAMGGDTEARLVVINDQG